MLVPHTPFACSLVLSALSSPQCRPSERYVGYAYILPYGLAAFQVSLRGIVCVSLSSALQRCLSRPGVHFVPQRPFADSASTKLIVFLRTSFPRPVGRVLR